MALHKRKTLRKVMAAVFLLFLTVLFCVSPCSISRAYAAYASDISAKAVLSKGSFGILKKADKAYYIVDEFGNIIDSVYPADGTDLDRYVGKQILVKDNLFAGLLESRRERRGGFLSRLREYLSGVVPKPKIVLPNPRPEPIEPPIGIIVPMYGVEPPDYIIEPIGPIEKPVPPYDIIRPMYGVEPPESIKEELPLRGEPTVRPAAEQTKEQSDKMDVVQKQDADRAELAEKNIKVIPEPSQKKDILNQKKE